MKEQHKEIALVLTISGIIGTLVSLPFILMGIEKKYIYLLYGFLVGAIIGGTAKMAFKIILLNLNRHPLFCFITAALIIAAGTSLGVWISPLDQWLPLIIMVILAEITGLLFAFIMWRYTRKLNKNLQQIQKKIREKGKE